MKPARPRRSGPASGTPDFTKVFKANYEDLARYCARLCGDPDTGEDIAQEAMVRLYEREVPGTPEGIRSWLFTAGTRLARDRHRVESNRLRLLAEQPPEQRQPETPDTAVERSEARARVRATLNRLTPRDREILLLRHSGFSYGEIAGTLGVAATSVGTLLARAERRFVEAHQEADASADTREQGP